jgi:hypothetical protein
MRVCLRQGRAACGVLSAAFAAVAAHDRRLPPPGRLLLRCINPSEAALVSDRASGAVVRFRLGGSVFPPIVYYKVFLRNAVTDLGAFAPRDYTVGKPDQFYMLRRHNDGCVNEVRAQAVRDVTHQVDTSLWYHRFENNGWRPIANKHLHAHDQVSHTTAARRNPNFHHMGEVRKMMATKKREDKRRRWIERMFRPSETRPSKDALDLDLLAAGSPGGRWLAADAWLAASLALLLILALLSSGPVTRACVNRCRVLPHAHTYDWPCLHTVAGTQT